MMSFLYFLTQNKITLIITVTDITVKKIVKKIHQLLSTKTILKKTKHFTINYTNDIYL